jgi:DNA-directed RNA polymerase alpha subunit
MEIYGGPRKRTKKDKSMKCDQVTNTRLCNVALSVRTVNTFENFGILTVGDLQTRTRADLLSIPNIGEITVKKCIKILNELNLKHNF